MRFVFKGLIFLLLFTKNIFRNTRGWKYLRFQPYLWFILWSSLYHILCKVFEIFTSCPHLNKNKVPFRKLRFSCYTKRAESKQMPFKFVLFCSITTQVGPRSLYVEVSSPHKIRHMHLFATLRSQITKLLMMKFRSLLLQHKLKCRRTAVQH